MEMARLYFIRHVRDSMAPDGTKRTNAESFDEMIHSLDDRVKTEYIHLFIKYGMLLDQLQLVESSIPINMNKWYEINQHLMDCGLNMAKLNNASSTTTQLIVPPSQRHPRQASL